MKRRRDSPRVRGAVQGSCRRGQEVLSLSLAVKLGSIVVHADEATGPMAHPYDVVALRRLLEDPEVMEWLKAMGPLVPLKRVSHGDPGQE